MPRYPVHFNTMYGRKGNILLFVETEMPGLPSQLPDDAGVPRLHPLTSTWDAPMKHNWPSPVNEWYF